VSTPAIWWTVLGIEPTGDSGAIRRAYAAKLKVTRPEDDRTGFESLRAAYEFALGWARQKTTVVADPPAETANPQPKTAVTPPPLEKNVAIDAEQETLRRAFAELQAMMAAKRSHSAEASRALHTILGSPALENVSVEQRAQHQLAVVLARSIPTSDPLLERAIARFQWDRPETELDLTAPVAAILSRVRDLQFLEALQSGSSPYSPAFRGLQRRKLPFISWAMTHFQKAGVPTEYQLLQLIRVHHPTLLAALDSSAVAWWDALVSRPRVSFPIILAGLVIAAIGGFAAAAQEGAQGWLLHMGRATLVIVGLVLWKLYLLDWPRHLLRTKFPLPSAQLLAGWLPASIGIILLSMIPAWTFVLWIVSALALGAAQWAWIVGWFEDGDSRNLMRIPLVRVLAFNILAFLWWISVTSKAAPATPQLHVAVYCALTGTALGLPVTIQAWASSLTSSQRWLWLIATAGMTLVAAACLFLLTDREVWRPIAAAMVMIPVIMHRHFALLLGKHQQEIRLGWGVCYFIGLVIITARAEPSLMPVDTVLKGFGSLLVSTVLMCTLMAMWSEWRQSSASQRVS
jgi:hypothetical protein